MNERTPIITARWFRDCSRWVCDCGEVCDPFSPDWRWNGMAWQHSHGHHLGHVDAQKKKEDRRP